MVDLEYLLQVGDKHQNSQAKLNIKQCMKWVSALIGKIL